jgi:hypothetical protein
MSRNRFTNPADGTFYDWQVNHSDEGGFGKDRQIAYSANTANTGLIEQQGDATPLLIKLTGTIFHKHQIEEFIKFWKLCENQTVYFKDFAGEEYEVLITSFVPVRKRTVKNPRDFAHAPLWYWTYELELNVVRVISGLWVGVVS